MMNDEVVLHIWGRSLEEAMYNYLQTRDRAMVALLAGQPYKDTRFDDAVESTPYDMYAAFRFDAEEMADNGPLVTAAFRESDYAITRALARRHEGLALPTR